MYKKKIELPTGGQLLDMITRQNGDTINVRLEPTTNSKVVHEGRSRESLLILSGSVKDEKGYCWHKVKMDDLQTIGWVRADLLDIWLDYPQ